MYLLHTTSLSLKQFFSTSVPPYAILSHTWDEEEATFEQVSASISPYDPGYRKVFNFCEAAKARGYEWVWIDTCCIDKRSSAELSEAINSMYRYYSDADECLIYLSDVPGIREDVAWQRNEQMEAFDKSTWFTRGWTLQELIAPKRRIFLSAHWEPIEYRDDLIDRVARITGVDARLLRDRNELSTFCTAERMSWASRRKTTREEDIVYSLFGIFNVSMPILYGEGATRAFRRLQEEIIRTSFDQSIFVWRGYYASSGFFAKSPADFKDTPRLGIWAAVYLSPFAMTNVGLSLRLNVLELTEGCQWLPEIPGPDVEMAIIACDVWHESRWTLLAIYVQAIANSTFYVNGQLCTAYRRVRCDQLIVVPPENVTGQTGPDVSTDLLVLEDEQFALVNRANAHDLIRDAEDSEFYAQDEEMEHKKPRQLRRH